MAEKKVICPECNTNMKGVKAKTCRDCAQKKFHATKIEAKRAKQSAETPVKKEQRTNSVRVGDTTPDGKYYL